MSDWKPIETAPKDGTAVLLLHHISGNDAERWVPWASISAVIGWWDNHRWQICFTYDGCADTEGSFSVFWQDIAEPTHWMPLPPPPNTEETRQAADCVQVNSDASLNPFREIVCMLEDMAEETIDDAGRAALLDAASHFRKLGET